MALFRAPAISSKWPFSGPRLSHPNGPFQGPNHLTQMALFRAPTISPKWPFSGLRPSHPNGPFQGPDYLTPMAQIFQILLQFQLLPHDMITSLPKWPFLPI